MSDARLLERAFEIARSGKCRSTVELEKRLQQEGFANVPAALAGPSLRKQLRHLIKAALLPADLLS